MLGLLDRRVLAAASLFVAVAATLAVAAATATAATPTTSATPVARSAAAQGSMRLYLQGVFFVKGNAVTVPRRAVVLDGVLRPYVAGQSVTVRAFLGHRLIATRSLTVEPSRSQAYGHFSTALSSPGPGNVTVRVTHAATSVQGASSASRRFAALDQHAGFGSTGRFVELVQQRLAALHLYIPRTGVYDQGTGLALDAYHRLLGWGTYQSLDGRTIRYLLDGWGQFKVRYPHHGRHAEGNLGRQLVALVDGSRVDLIFPISSGKPSTPTVLGDFHVYRRVPGYLPDGMYDSSFFIGGYAIHGYDPAPDYPASHGCMRLPIADAAVAYNWLNFGDWVDVYY
ncbi:MAG: hypothetical protein DLM64_04000 [Solirubrobacterales bacterium]|nr:MAG: hypothetical protein DLM64_04000 [Solirubrobacterales bacterium]